MTTNNQQLKQLLDFAVDIARETGKITWRHYQGSFVAERKADNSFVTIADREAEGYLRTRIAEAFPDDSILGEEEESKQVHRIVVGYLINRWNVLICAWSAALRCADRTGARR